MNLSRNIVVSIKLPDIKEFDSSYPSYGWYFFLNETGVGIGNFDSDKKFLFAHRKLTGKLKRYYEVDERKVMFFKEYDYIRDRIMKQLLPLQNKREEDLNFVTRLRDKYQKSEQLKLNYLKL